MKKQQVTKSESKKVKKESVPKAKTKKGNIPTVSTFADREVAGITLDQIFDDVQLGFIKQIAAENNLPVEQVIFDGVSTLMDCLGIEFGCCCGEDGECDEECGCKH